MVENAEHQEAYPVFWRGEEVGILQNPVPDMWYLEGPFVPSESAAAEEFSRRARLLDAKDIFRDLALGIKARIVFGDTEQNPTTVVIFSLVENALFLRRVFGEEAVAWVEANVPD